MERAAVPGTAREERLRRWIEDYAGAVWKTCFACLQDAALSEDAMQETFFKAWRAMDSFEKKNIQNEKAWLLHIAVNAARDCRRSAWFRHEERRRDPEEIMRGRAAPQREESGLYDQIMRLPQKFSRPLILYYYQGMTLEETASILRITKSSVHRRLQKAKEMLKPYLPGGDEYDG